MLNSPDAWDSLAFPLCPDEVLPSGFQVHVQGLSRFRSLSITCAEGMWSGSETESEEAVIVRKKAVPKRKDPLGPIEDAPDVDIMYGTWKASCQQRPMGVEGHHGVLRLGCPASRAEEEYQTPETSFQVHALPEAAYRTHEDLTEKSVLGDFFHEGRTLVPA